MHPAKRRYKLTGNSVGTYWKESATATQTVAPICQHDDDLHSRVKSPWPGRSKYNRPATQNLKMRYILWDRLRANRRIGRHIGGTCG